ncbi:MAG: glycosyltransferase family 2 protein [Candidatus Eremiobacteraeota bacterium]|nr:glycosyltransferase family 2 protein [Candidatus Eremiobacteraeota bacterium]
MSQTPPGGIAAHLILGPREEPFLAAMLASIEDAASLLLVNDNSAEPSPHAAILRGSRFGVAGSLIVDCAPFTEFAAARNRCLELHAAHGALPWIMFVDADEVHGEGISAIARALGGLPPGYDFVDGYTWHLFGSFDYYTSIERRMMFFRYRPGVRWEGAVHERLQGLDGKRLALPYVYAHYGHTLTPRRHAEKGRHYSSLGAPGDVLREEELDDFDVRRYFAPVYPRLLRFRESHPQAALSTTARLRGELAQHHRLTAEMAARQPLAIKMRNVVRKANYELRWRARALDPLARATVGTPRITRRRG